MLHAIVMSPDELQGDKTYAPGLRENPKTQICFGRDKVTLIVASFPTLETAKPRLRDHPGGLL